MLVSEPDRNRTIRYALRPGCRTLLQPHSQSLMVLKVTDLHSSATTPPIFFFPHTYQITDHLQQHNFINAGMKFLLLAVLALQGVLARTIPKWYMDNEYIRETLENQEYNINDALQSPVNTISYPPVIPRPTIEQRTLKFGELPPYVIEYAPYVHLYLEERYMPCDVRDFVKHFHAEYGDGTIVDDTEYGALNISMLSSLPNQKDIFLTANEDFDSNPDWITGVENQPSIADGKIKKAPATLIVVDKGNGWVDAFWFYFYSFNLGPFVLGNGPFGNHVGDWEHSLVRFYRGKPIIVWMSAHSGGGAFLYDKLEKHEVNTTHPIIYSARGTHANYVSVGTHPHDLPYEILCDFTDKGPLWNPSKNYLGYFYDGSYVLPIEKSANCEHSGRELEYGDWLTFAGHWGDRKLPNSDRRQKYSIIGGFKYIDGPRGPLAKNLLRTIPCERTEWWNFWNGCNVRENIKYGVGIESEGYNCGNVFSHVKSQFLRKILQMITLGGWFCYVADLVYG